MPILRQCHRLDKATPHVRLAKEYRLVIHNVWDEVEGLAKVQAQVGKIFTRVAIMFSGRKRGMIPCREGGTSTTTDEDDPSVGPICLALSFRKHLASSANVVTSYPSSEGLEFTIFFPLSTGTGLFATSTLGPGTSTTSSSSFGSSSRATKENNC